MNEKEIIKGFPINIGGKQKALWDGTRTNCGLCDKIVGIAFELKTKVAILFSLESPIAERHKCDEKKEMRHG